MFTNNLRRRTHSTVAKWSVLFSKTPAHLVWTPPLKPLPSTQAAPWDRLVSFLQGPVFVHTVFGTTNAIGILGTRSKSWVPLRSSKDKSCDGEQGTQGICLAPAHGPILLVCLFIWSFEGLKEHRWNELWTEKKKRRIKLEHLAGF